ncbi:MAG: glycosyltransferase family 2 protein [Gammaproteobacteria bacterium]|nr:glycosyltransferase family 2 protein [Gammaproteobacteria bacterium]NIR84243.1 glycosyltransferase family 2 protein [Gammaproteobacteria bacterium]NIR89713.1 glycosyltransferase family 2 protein [Gammaproteobacteria bacterium]NIU05401.1 glycosyltransferase family 2 protein [Gammaproteobacteria bacterium]NIV52347.1 glycosyltransferase [Gammaproteobacteria bacterium]
MPTLSIIVPCYNEGRTLATVLAAVRASPVANKEIIVVDDGSTDGSAELIRGPLAALVDIALHHPVNCGKGAALRTGVAVARGDYVLMQDADLEYDPRDHPRLIQPLLADEADVVYGSRFLNGPARGCITTRAYLANRFLTWLSNRFTGLALTDMETCYKVFRRELIQSVTLEEDGFGFEPEVTAKLAARPGVRIREVPITYDARTTRQGKKIGWRDGVRAVYCIARYSTTSKSAATQGVEADTDLSSRTGD